MKTKLLCCLFPCLIASVAAAADLSALAETELKLEHLALRGDGAGTKPLAEKLEAELAAAPTDPALQYSLAFAYYAEASASRAERNMDVAVMQVDAALKLLEKINDPAWEVEATAFRGYLMNQMIGLKGMGSAVSLGPKSASLLNRAKGKAPQNPRVLFFNGVVLVTTPEMFGGDLAGGAGSLEKAVELYDKPSETVLPRWGKAEALAWLGLARQKSGDPAGAKAAWDRALAIEPELSWIKLVLLPSLEKSAGGAKK